MGREDRGGSGECAVPEQFYLAEDGNFAGAVAYEEDGDAYLLRSACLRDYRGCPCPSAAAPASAAPTATAWIPAGNSW